MSESHFINEQTKKNCDRFKGSPVANKYPSQYRDHVRRDQREKNAILRCMKHVPQNTHVFDFPCGTGRLIKLLMGAGYRVTGVDSSSSMLGLARENCSELSGDSSSVDFYERDVFDSGFDDGEIDVIICNRLFHHFKESSDRQKAFAELSRICNGPIIVSFFNAFSLSMMIKKWSKKIRGKKMQDRIAISMAQFEEEAAACGLHITYKTGTFWGVSPHWYVIFEHNYNASPIED